VANVSKPAKTKRGKKAKAVAQENTPVATNAPALALPAKISVGSIVISNAHLQFTDRSLQPNVNASIEQLNGTISGLSSEGKQPAELNLAGKVGETAPVEITGKVNPFDQKQPAEFKISFKDVDLHPVGPYTGKFLGYRLNKGKLSMELNYHLADNKLKSENLIVLDQLMLGEKVESAEATKLPVRLAIAVMKDRNGRIELNVPIDGSLDDPQFHLGKVISRAVINIFTKIVTSPFAALGAVFGGKGEEISFQEFDAGSSELLPASAQKLDALVKGLYERPGLQVEIEGSIDPRTDLDALRKLKLQREFRTKKWKSLRKSEQARMKPDDVQLAPDERAGYLKAAYTAAFSDQAIALRASGSSSADSVTVHVTKAAAYPVSVKSNSDDKGATALLKETMPAKAAPPPQDMEDELLRTIEVTPSDFEALATERAQRVKDYILRTGQVEAERIFLTQTGTQSATNKGSRVYLHLQ
jgi:hypothetical protein